MLADDHVVSAVLGEKASSDDCRLEVSATFWYTENGQDINSIFSCVGKLMVLAGSSKSFNNLGVSFVKESIESTTGRVRRLYKREDKKAFMRLIATLYSDYSPN